MKVNPHLRSSRFAVLDLRHVRVNINAFELTGANGS